MELLIISILLGILAVDGFFAYWIARRLFASVQDTRQGKVYKWIVFVVLFLLFVALSYWVIASNIMLQR